jgi:hypothetical protein
MFVPCMPSEGAYVCAIGPRVESREASWTCASDEAPGPSKGLVLLESSFSREGKEPDASFLKMSVAHVTNINFKVKSSR